MTDSFPMNDELRGWLDYVAGFTLALTGAPGEAAPLPVAATTADLGPVLLLSPHPDDETITGLLPLRLLREAGVPVINLALSFGSAQERRTARQDELAAACRETGFASRPVIEPFGFDRLRRPGKDDLAQWQEQVAVLVEWCRMLGPSLVCHPHGADRHPAHIAAAMLATEALCRYSREEKTAVLTLETECWQPLAGPNLLVGAAGETVARLCLALSRHAGEVARNPYHRRQPVRMMDTVFRGAELVGGFGSGALDFVFGELYRLRRYAHGLAEEPTTSLVLPPDSPLSLAVLSRHFAT